MSYSPHTETDPATNGSAGQRRDRATRQRSRLDEQKPASEHTTRRSGRSSARPSSGQDLRAWAAAVAAELPPLTDSQVAAVARLATRLDANDNRKRAA